MLKNFDHALVLREDDPILPAILGSIRTARNSQRTPPESAERTKAFETELATAYPDARIVVTKETMTVEGMIKNSLQPAERQIAHLQDNFHQR